MQYKKKNMTAHQFKLLHPMIRKRIKNRYIKNEKPWPTSNESTIIGIKVIARICKMRLHLANYGVGGYIAG